jgi:glyoxylase-like metal-dependent hydrolase (beta-lactamase superfamily II)
VTTRVHAIRYASRDGKRGDHFLHEHSSSGHSSDEDRPDEPHPTAYYAWLVVSPEVTVLVDTGMGPGADRVPGLRRERSVADGLRALGVPPERVPTVVLTHLHYDHAGGVRDFPGARFLLQRSEVDEPENSWLVDRADVEFLLGSGRLDLLDGDTEIAPGISVHHVGGHTAGMQIVRVRTESGPVVIASDACHFLENLRERRLGPLTHSAPDSLRAFDRIDELAGPPGLVFAGHDPASPESLP